MTRETLPQFFVRRQDLSIQRWYSDLVSLSIRTQIYFVFGFYSCWICTDFALSTLNAIRPPESGKHAHLAWTYEYAERQCLQLLLGFVPRMLLSVCGYLSVACFLGCMFFFTHEVELWLPDFLMPAEFPTVDLFLPRYKEPWLVFKPVVQAALDMAYPVDKLRVHVLDDGRDEKLKQLLISELNMGSRDNLFYKTRSSGKHAKAGNLNSALRHTSGELVMVLDADMIARPEFLLRTVPHFLKPDSCGCQFVEGLAFVQTAQRFYNANHLMVRLMDGANSLFYTLSMPSASGMGVATCVGTGYVMRRAAIEQLGGWATGYAVEDSTTSLMLHEAGWHSKYLDVDLVRGLSPDTLDEFFQQRLRWGVGHAQLMAYLQPWRMNSLSMFARLCYVSGQWTIFLVPILLALLIVRHVAWLVMKWILRGAVPLELLTTAKLCRHVSSCPSFRLLPLLLEYGPLSAIAGLPRVALTSKLEMVMCLFALFPVDLQILWQLFRGNLVPGAARITVKASSEAWGDSGFPRLASLNLALCVVTLLAAVISARAHLLASTSDKSVLFCAVVFTIYISVPAWISLATTISGKLWKAPFMQAASSCPSCIPSRPFRKRSGALGPLGVLGLSQQTTIPELDSYSPQSMNSMSRTFTASPMEVAKPAFHAQGLLVRKLTWPLHKSKVKYVVKSFLQTTAVCKRSLEKGCRTCKRLYRKLLQYR